MPQNGFCRMSQDPEVTKLLNGETSVEEMLAGAAKLPVESRSQVYQSAANKLAGTGDCQRLDDIPRAHLVRLNGDSQALKQAH